MSAVFYTFFYDCLVKKYFMISEWGNPTDTRIIINTYININKHE